MPVIHRLSHSKASIHMYADDHMPPHVHVYCPDHAACVAIESMEITRGTLPGDVLADARRWMSDNKVSLRAKWRELNELDR